VERDLGGGSAFTLSVVELVLAALAWRSPRSSRAALPVALAASGSIPSARTRTPTS
jgi:hypothetical protein